jgi:chromosome segregation ATPase
VLSSAVSSLNSKINSGKNRVERLEESIAQNVLTVASDETTTETRIALVLKIKNQHGEIIELKDKIHDYEDELVHKRAEYASLEQPVFY